MPITAPLLRPLEFAAGVAVVEEVLVGVLNGESVELGTSTEADVDELVVDEDVELLVVVVDFEEMLK